VTLTSGRITKANINTMKKLIFFCLSLLVITAAQAQTETLTLRAVKKGEEPKEVMDAIKQDFPNAIVRDLSMLPGKLYGERWSLSFDDRLDGALPDFYLVNLKEGSETYKAVYDKAGNIKSSKFIINQAQLPKEVTSTIAAKYPDWTIIRDREKITYNEGTVKDAIHVEIQKDKMYRSLFLDNNGKLLKDALLRRSK
jgi:hypothetical protein